MTKDGNSKASSSGTGQQQADPFPAPTLAQLIQANSNLYGSQPNSAARKDAYVDLRSSMKLLFQSGKHDAVLASSLDDGNGKGGGQDPLEVFDVAKESLIALHILSVRVCIDYSKCDVRYLDRLFSQATYFANEYDTAHITQDDRAAIARFGRGYLDLAKFLRQAGRTIYGLSRLLETLVPHAWGTCLTPLHSVYLEACVASKRFEDALGVVARPLEQIYRHHFDLTYLDHLRYRYLSGVCLAALDDWVEAAGEFESAVSAPSTAASAIQLASYKKLVLCQLIQHGRALPLPKYVSAAVTRAIKQQTGPYKSLIESFESKSSSKTLNISAAEQDVFTKDGNWGLVQRVIDTWQSRKILKLTQTYEVLTLSDLVRLLGMQDSPHAQAEVTRELYRMVSSSLVNATLKVSPTSGTIVTFLPSCTVSSYADAETLDRISTLNKRAADLAKTLWTDDRRVANTTRYLQKVAKEESFLSGAGMMGGTGAMDEDIMEISGFSAGGGGSGGGWGGGSGGGGGGKARQTYDDNY